MFSGYFWTWKSFVTSLKCSFVVDIWFNRRTFTEDCIAQEDEAILLSKFSIFWMVYRLPRTFMFNALLCNKMREPLSTLKHSPRTSLMRLMQRSFPLIRVPQEWSTFDEVIAKVIQKRFNKECIWLLVAAVRMPLISCELIRVKFILIRNYQQRESFM